MTLYLVSLLLYPVTNKKVGLVACVRVTAFKHEPTSEDVVVCCKAFRHLKPF